VGSARAARALLGSSRVLGAQGLSVFGVAIGWLGPAILAGWLAGAFVTSRLLPRVGVPASYALELYPVALLAGTLGAKGWAVLETFLEPGGPSWRQVLESRSGATYYGGLMLGAAAVFAKILWDGREPGAVTSAVAPGLALAQAFGRVGCLLVGDDYGAPTSLPWGIAFPHGLPPTDLPVHPTQIYESLWGAAMAVFLGRRVAPGRLVFAEYLVLEGAGRFAVEFLRTNPRTLGGLSTSQALALVWLAAGSAVLWRRRRSAKRSLC